MKITVIIAIIIIIAGGAYFLSNQADTPQVADENDDMIPTEPDNGIGDGAEPLDNQSGLPAEQQAQVVLAQSLGLTGLTESEAQTLAEANNVMFRVVERDGEVLPATMDYRPGRINATVEGGVVTGYTVEGSADM